MPPFAQDPQQCKQHTKEAALPREVRYVRTLGPPEASLHKTPNGIVISFLFFSAPKCIRFARLWPPSGHVSACSAQLEPDDHDQYLLNSGSTAGSKQLLFSACPLNTQVLFADACDAGIS